MSKLDESWACLSCACCLRQEEGRVCGSQRLLPAVAQVSSTAGHSWPLSPSRPWAFHAWTECLIMPVGERSQGTCLCPEASFADTLAVFHGLNMTSKSHRRIWAAAIASKLGGAVGCHRCSGLLYCCSLLRLMSTGEEAWGFLPVYAQC